MQAVIDIEFKELLRIAKNLPESKLSELKAEIDKNSKKEHDRNSFKSLLLKGPTFSEEQLETISQTRTAINKWRTK